MGLSTFIIIVSFLCAYILVILAHAVKVMKENRSAGIVRLLVVAILTIVMFSVCYKFVLGHSEQFKEALYHVCSEQTIDYLKTSYEQCFGSRPILFAVQIVGGCLDLFFSSAIVAILSCSIVAIAHKERLHFTAQIGAVDIQEKKP